MGEFFSQSTAEGQLEGSEQLEAEGCPWEEEKAGVMKHNHPAGTAAPFKDGPDQALQFWMGLLGFFFTKMGALVLPELKGES